MKKIVFILSFIFVATMGATTFAIVSHANNGDEVCTVNNTPDKKPCSKDCTCDDCKAKAAQAETTTTSEAKPACCKKTETSECPKAKECTKEKKAEETQPAKTE